MSPSGARNGKRFQSFNGSRPKVFKGEYFMPKSSERNRSNRSRNSNDWGVTEMVRERPIAAAAAAAGAAAAGLFLWSRRAQISNQLSNLSDQIGDWTENMGSSEGPFETGEDTAGLTTSSGSGGAGRSARSTARRGMSETGGGNASLGRTTGGAGTTSSASGRGRAQQAPTT
jgi:hypothetical protein